MKKILIVGLGIGSMYKKLLEPFYQVVTVDLDETKKPTYTSLDEAIEKEVFFNLSIVCTPVFLHSMQAEILIPISDVVLVEKPGFIDEELWEKLYSRRKNLFMTKNNIFREEMPHIKDYVQRNIGNIDKVYFSWLNNNRVPFPGFWFTEKAKSMGGVISDSFPHLLSEFYYIFNDLVYLDERSAEWFGSLDFLKKQNFTLEEVQDTEYGFPNPEGGVYDVEDYALLKLFKDKVNIIGWWKAPNNEPTKIGITVVLLNGTEKYFDFDLCPEYCYFKQFDLFLNNLTEEEKEKHFKMDMFINDVLKYGCSAPIKK